MKIFLCLAIVLVLVGLSMGEECRSTGDCNHVHCDSGFTLECHERQCTCTQTGSKCAVAGDCHGNCNRDWHCVDGTCRCGFGFGGGPVGK